MTEGSSSKKRVAAAVLLVAVISIVIPVFFSLRVTSLINNEFYRNGLEFSSDWNNAYWYHDNLLLYSSTAVTIFLCSSIGFSGSSRKHVNFKYASYVLMFSSFLLSLFSLYALSKIDSVVNGTFYQYGLQFSHEWADPYFTVFWFAIALIGFSVLAIFFLMASKIFGDRKTTRINLKKIFNLDLAATGTISLIISVLLNSSILAYIGLGLLFWGLVLTYVGTEEYVKRVVLDTAEAPLEANQTILLRELGYTGPALYLPPLYFRNPDTQLVYVLKSSKLAVPDPKEVKIQEAGGLGGASKGILLVPPGAALVDLFEKTLGVSFAAVDFGFLQENLTRLFVEKLEIVQSFDLQLKGNDVAVTIEDPVDRTSKAVLDKPFILGSVLSSAIASVLAKTTGKVIVVIHQKVTEKGRRISLEYRMLEGGANPD